MRTVTLVLCLFVATVANAFEIVIDRGVDRLVPIAIVPFGVGENAVDLTEIVHQDLSSSGQFRPIAPADMLSLPSSASEVLYRDWRILGVEYLVVGYVSVDGLGQLTLAFDVVDINSERVTGSGQVKGSLTEPRSVAHHASDEIYRAITGLQGAFSTQIAYVLVEDRTRETEHFNLVVSDFDGERDRIRYDSPEPIMSPTWSPDGNSIAFVSFESGGSRIYELDLASGSKRMIAGFEGINSAPRYSPDGREMAMVLSRDGNPDIYTVELATNVIRRVTNHRAIDTEPSWMRDGREIMFTSDRGGTPQIYRVSLDSLRVNRITYEGGYNSQPRILPDDDHFIFVHRSSQGFHIAWRDIAGDRATRILSSNVLDESPAVSPNGVMLMYSTKIGRRGILSIVSVDGEVEYKLTSGRGDIIEPAWSPFMPLTTTFVEL